jgi:hypothetical protein
MTAVGGRCDRAFGGFPPPAARENGGLKVTPSIAGAVENAPCQTKSASAD